MDKNIMKKEAINRLSSMINDDITVDNFDNMIPVSIHIGGIVRCIKIDNVDVFKEIKDEFEKRTGAIVYYGIVSNLGFGDTLSLLYVSPYKEDWNYEKLNGNNVVANVYNFDDETEEIGSIGITNISDGKWIRIY